MRKFACVTLLLAFGVFGAVLVQAQSEKQQPGEMRVFIASLKGPDADLVKSIREKLISDFESHGIIVTEIKENADAILTGSGLKGEEIPRLCRGGSNSLTFTGVHPRNSRCEPTKAHVKEKPDGPIGKFKPLRMGVQISRSIYPQVSSQSSV